MSKKEIFEYFSSNAYSYNLKQTFVMLLIGLAVGLVIYFTYYICSEKVVYNRRFNLSILITVLITDLIMLLISSNIAVSLGMVGALSIVRFRTAIKDSRDTIFIFWAIAEGLSVGTKSFKMTYASVFFIAIIFILGSKVISTSYKYLMVVSASKDGELCKLIEEKLATSCNSYRLRTSGAGKDKMEFIYELKAKKEIRSDLVLDIEGIEGVNKVNCVIESGDIVG